MSTEVANESGYEVAEEEFAALARYVLEQLHVHPQAELSILFVTSDIMTELHERWMDEPGPTDVLSFPMDELRPDRKSTRLNSSHVAISYAVFCLKKKKKE